GVQKNDGVAFVLDHALGLFNDHLRHLHVAFGGFVERRADDLGAAAGAFHVGHFFGAFVDEQDEQIGFRIVLQNGVGQLLHQDGFAGAGGGDDQAAGSFANGTNQIQD